MVHKHSVIHSHKQEQTLKQLGNIVLKSYLHRKVYVTCFPIYNVKNKVMLKIVQ